MENVAVYGFSTEGYRIASRLAGKGAPVHLIDETMNVAVLLQQGIARTYPDVTALTQDEPLLDTRPLESAVSEAKYLFFAPRIRKTGIDSKTEINAKFKDATAHLKEGSSVICNMPVGLGGNAQNISLLKYVTGMEVGKGISYYYHPLGGAGQRGLVGTVRGNDGSDLAGILEEGVEFAPMAVAEREHAIDILSKFSRVVSTVEMYKHGMRVTTAPRRSWVFLDEMAYGLTDLHLIKESHDSIGSVMYMIKGGIRAIDAYIKKLVDGIRFIIRESGLRLSRTNVVIAWNIDRHGMRGDRLEVAESLTARLLDYTSKVERLDSLRDYYAPPNTLVVACSQANYEEALERQEQMESVVVTATPAIFV